VTAAATAAVARAAERAEEKEEVEAWEATVPVLLAVEMAMAVAALEVAKEVAEGTSALVRLAEELVRAEAVKVEGVEEVARAEATEEEEEEATANGVVDKGLVVGKAGLVVLRGLAGAYELGSVTHCVTQKKAAKGDPPSPPGSRCSQTRLAWHSLLEVAVHSSLR
jgi:hypothetical protein